MCCGFAVQPRSWRRMALGLPLPLLQWSQ